MGAFTDLLKEENFNRIQIDERLREPFKNVLKKMQLFFDSNDYEKLKDYKAFFEKYLLLPLESEAVKYSTLGYFKNNAYYRGFTIELNDEPSKIGAGGFYRKGDSRICIDLSCLSNEEYLEGVIFHEFTHFIVMHDLEKGKCSEEIYDGGFINEALTQMLTENSYPNYASYVPQTSMIRYVNGLMDKTNDYRSFLKGQYSEYGASWMNFRININKYHKKYKDTGFKLDTIKDEEYIQAQRCVVELATSSIHKVNSLAEYISLILKITKNIPALDDEWLDKYLKRLDEHFIEKNFNHVSNKTKNILIAKLGTLREKYIELELINNIQNNTKVISLNGIQFVIKRTIDNKYQIEINNSIKFEMNHFVSKCLIVPTPDGEKTLTISLNDDTLNLNLENEVSIDINGSDFKYVDKEKLADEKTKEIEELRLQLEPKEVSEIYKLLEYLNNQSVEVLNIERYHIPTFKETSFSSSNVYMIDIIRDGIMQKLFLNSSMQSPIAIEDINNFDLKEFKGTIGVSSYLLVLEDLGKVLKGYTYSSLGEKAINNILANMYMNKYYESITEETVQANLPRINSDGLSKDDIKAEVADLLAQEELSSLSKEELERVKKEILSRNDKIVLYEKDGTYHIGKQFTDNIVLEVRSECIYNSNTKTPLSEVIEQILDSKDNTNGHTI